jgi:hypothetical protein
MSEMDAWGKWCAKRMDSGASFGAKSPTSLFVTSTHSVRISLGAVVYNSHESRVCIGSDRHLMIGSVDEARPNNIRHTSFHSAQSILAYVYELFRTVQ